MPTGRTRCTGAPLRGIKICTHTEGRTACVLSGAPLGKMFQCKLHNGSVFSYSVACGYGDGHRHALCTVGVRDAGDAFERTHSNLTCGGFVSDRRLQVQMSSLHYTIGLTCSLVPRLYTTAPRQQETHDLQEKGRV